MRGRVYTEDFEIVMNCAVFQTAFGWVGVAGVENHVRQVVLPHPDRHWVEKRLDQPLVSPDSLPPWLQRLTVKIQRYFAGQFVVFEEPVDLSLFSDFSRSVLEECRRIQYGATCSYAELAARCGRPRAARAVGTVMARNPTPVVVPCHRVIRSDGTLGGFGGGLALKRRMLQLERSVAH